MGVLLRFVRYDANVVLRTEGLPRHRRTRHPPAGRETLVCIRRERVGFTKNTAMRHRRGGGRAMEQESLGSVFFHFCANQASNVGVGDHPVPGVD